MRIMVPSNVSMIFEIIMPFVIYDVLDSEYSTELVLDFDYD